MLISAGAPGLLMGQTTIGPESRQASLLCGLTKKQANWMHAMCRKGQGKLQQVVMVTLHLLAQPASKPVSFRHPWTEVWSPPQSELCAA